MRVTHVITRLIIGGAQENTIASVLGLEQRGVAVDLIAGPTRGPEGSLEPELAALPGRLTIIPSLVRPIHPWHDLRALAALTRRFQATRPDIVHTHSGKAGFLGRLAARRARVPIVVHTIHGPSFGAFQGPAANIAFRWAERLAASWTSHFVAVANAMRDQYLAARIGKPGQYTRIFSGFRLEPYLESRNDPALRARWGFDSSDIIVGKLARLFKLKGHADLLAVAPGIIAQQPRIRFLLIGDGAWRERFQALVARQSLQRHVVFTGLVPPAEVPGLIGIMDLLVHLSRREGLPRSLPQALAAARPVVAFDCDGAREVCLEGKTGFLVRPGDRPTLSERILRLANDSALRQRLGAQGRDLVRQWFPVEEMVDALHRLYQRLLDSAGSSPGRP